MKDCALVIDRLYRNHIGVLYSHAMGAGLAPSAKPLPATRKVALVLEF